MRPEIIDRADEAVAQRDRRLPVKLRLRQGDVRAVADRVILRKFRRKTASLSIAVRMRHQAVIVYPRQRVERCMRPRIR